MTPTTRDTSDEKYVRPDRRSVSATLVERVLAKYGLATVLALALVYWLTTEVTGRMTRMEERIDGHISDTTYYLRAICLNVAKDEVARAGCIPPGKGSR